ncbi:unnamed protein product [Vitrella brassicaformis CCMP3155]|uniref:Uncharacterized protein n=1 Tax=Vitrella brassicaformis (strain CCMP3155) TaxID=1169540 RepID=A0A0G4FY75_VITBC|nr:unnamed protein product [Vitrella brassicaformis CCMP3155]|mmetsp:Transcript_36222/g.90381  ORF Transcript_36222/g.90381 Transcript_36222/m.90381 type:complete len:168 (-) Transcript_36222:232-735(-)|eukprot:CEM20116.1 unnamed protein product [Vitrella brassicaformis CCMP3155]
MEWRRYAQRLRDIVQPYVNRLLSSPEGRRMKQKADEFAKSEAGRRAAEAAHKAADYAVKAGQKAQYKMFFEKPPTSFQFDNPKWSFYPGSGFRMGIARGERPVDKQFMARFGPMLAGSVLLAAMGMILSFPFVFHKNYGKSKARYTAFIKEREARGLPDAPTNVRRG